MLQTYDRLSGTNGSTSKRPHTFPFAGNQPDGVHFPGRGLTPGNRALGEVHPRRNGTTLSIFDVDARTEKEGMSLDPLSGPHGIEISPDGTHSFITCEGSRNVTEVDLHLWKLANAYDTKQGARTCSRLKPAGISCLPPT